MKLARLVTGSWRAGAQRLEVIHRAARFLISRLDGGALKAGHLGAGVTPRLSKGHTMGKYKLWLHHQEIGRRLRDQINTLEQERGRVQKMTPDQSAPLPDGDNPIISALRAYTDSGRQLSNIDVIKAAMPKLDGEPEQRKPAPSVATPATRSAAPVAHAADAAVVASLLARADQIPSDPLEQMRQMAGSRDRSQSATPGASAAGASTQGASADSVQGWWQNRQQDDDE